MQANPSRSSLSSIQRLPSFPESKNVLSWFFSDAKKTDFVLCGEEHGSVENWMVYRHLIETGTFSGFAYELFDTWQEGVRGYVFRNKPIPSTISKQWRQMKQQDLVDGKVSKEFISFLSWLREYVKQRKDFQLILFDASSYPKGTFDWNTRDKIMTENLTRERKLLKAKKPILVGTGKLHAKQQPIFMRGVRRFPLGYHLKSKKTLSVDLQYLSGTYFNMKRKSFPNRLNGKKSQFTLSKTQKGYSILIKHSHPIHPVH